MLGLRSLPFRIPLLTALRSLIANFHFVVVEVPPIKSGYSCRGSLRALHMGSTCQSAPFVLHAKVCGTEHKADSGSCAQQRARRWQQKSNLADSICGLSQRHAPTAPNGRPRVSANEATGSNDKSFHSACKAGRKRGGNRGLR